MKEHSPPPPQLNLVFDVGGTTQKSRNTSPAITPRSHTGDRPHRRASTSRTRGTSQLLSWISFLKGDLRSSLGNVGDAGSSSNSFPLEEPDFAGFFSWLNKLLLLRLFSSKSWKAEIKSIPNYFSHEINRDSADNWTRNTEITITKWSQICTFPFLENQ